MRQTRVNLIERRSTLTSPQPTRPGYTSPRQRPSVPMAEVSADVVATLICRITKSPGESASSSLEIPSDL